MPLTPVPSHRSWPDRAARHGWLLAAALALVLFLPTLRYGFDYDDVIIIHDNPRIRSLASWPSYLADSWWGLPQDTMLYRPLTMAGFALNYAVGGLAPWGYHLVNVLLHVMNVALLWWLAWLVAGRGIAAARGATVAALIFAVHAVHVEVVAGVVGRAEVMMTTGYLAALIAALRAREAAGLAGRWRWAALGVLPATLLAIGSKEHGVTLPAAIALLALAPGGQSGIHPGAGRPAASVKAAARAKGAGRAGAKWRRPWAGLEPSLAMTCLGVALYMLARHAVLGALLRDKTFHIPEVDNPLVMLHGMDRAQGALAVLAHAFGLLLLPLRPSPNYGMSVYRPETLVNSLLWPVGLGALLMAVLAAWAWRDRPLARLGVAWMLVTMSLSSNLVVTIGTILGERLLYLPSAMACMIAGQAAMPPAPTRRRRLPSALALVLLGLWGAALLALHARYLPSWRDNRALMTYGLRRAPQCINIQIGMGLQCIGDGDLKEALRHFEEAVRQEPTYVTSTAWRGYALARLGRPEAMRELERAQAVEPTFWYVNEELARLLTKHGDAVRAEQILRDGVRLAPKSLEAWRALGEWLAGQGRHAEGDPILASMMPWMTPEDRVRIRKLMAPAPAGPPPPGQGSKTE
jgi:tetratricopeptide (TPR) repeat protein